MASARAGIRQRSQTQIAGEIDDEQSGVSVIQADARGQIKTRERVRDLAEVYTHQREVDAMLDLIPDGFDDFDTRFLEPACGSGNFLVEILARKLAHISATRFRVVEHYEHSVLRCLASVYGIDISFDNVEESQDRMRDLVYGCYATRWKPTRGFHSAVNTILDTNIICADTLKEAEAIEFIEYLPGPKQTFTRAYSPLIDSEQSAFYQSLEALPTVHYSKLGLKAAS